MPPTTPAPQPAPTPQPAAPPPPPPVAAPQPQPSGSSWPGAFGAINLIIKRIIANPLPFALYAVLTFIASAFFGPKISTSNGYTHVRYGSPLPFIVLLVFFLFELYYALALADGEPVSIGELFKRYRVGTYFSVVVAAILSILILIIAGLPILIPWIWVIPWLSMTVFVAADRHTGPIEAIKESRELASNHKGKVWGLLGVIILYSFVISIITRIVPILGALLSACFAAVETGALALLYRHLSASAPAAPVVATPAPPAAPVAPAPPTAV